MKDKNTSSIQALAFIRGFKHICDKGAPFIDII